MLNVCHFPAAFGAISTCFNACFHTADFLAAQCTRLTDFGANLAHPLVKRRTHQLKISRCLANLGTADHKTKMLCFNMLTANLKAMVHSALQADLMTMTAGFNTSLHGVFTGSVGLLVHGDSPESLSGG